MRHFVKSAGLALATLVLGAALVPSAHAQYIQVYSPPVFVNPPVVTYYQPPIYQPPVTAYYAPPPPITYSYYPPVTTVYAPPAVAYPAVYPAAVTTRTYVGYGIFRPRGVYTQSYVSPPGVVAPSYYTPYLWR